MRAFATYPMAARAPIGLLVLLTRDLHRSRVLWRPAAATQAEGAGRTIADFNSGRAYASIATDVAQFGLDIRMLSSS